MKKLTFAAFILASIAMTACHYGQNEAKDTLERNELYNTENADYSVNRAGEGGKMNATKTETTPVDTAVKAEPVAPAAAPEHK